MTREPDSSPPHRHSGDRHPAKAVSKECALGGLKVVGDWRHIPFLMIDSPQTKVFEDAVATKEGQQKGHWWADLKVIHPLPLEGVTSLKGGEEQVCLGIRDMVDARGGHAPSVSLVLARNITKLTDRQAVAFLEGRERSIAGVDGPHALPPHRMHQLRSQVKLVRATALQISRWKDRPLSPEYSMTMLVSHAQTAVIKASRSMPKCPSLVVLRHESSRVVTDQEARSRGVNFRTKTGTVTIAAGKAVPTILRQGEVAEQHDSLRLKERGNSGAINITQLACALLGIDPIPEDLVRQGLRPDSELDRWKAGKELPEALSSAIQQRRHAIREVLEQLVQR